MQPKLATALHMLYWKHEEQQKVMSTFFWEYYNGKREYVYIMSMRALVDHQLQKEQKYIYSKKKIQPVAESSGV